MKVEVIWRQNDDVVLELYNNLYERDPTYQDELVRVYETKAHYIIVDETNDSGGHLLYVEKNVPLDVAIIAAEKVIFDELTLNVDEEQEKERILEELAILDKYKVAIKHAKIVREETDYNELVTSIEVYIPAIIVKHVVGGEKYETK